MNHKSTSTISQPRLVADCDEVRTAIAQARADGKTVGLVPTMGALHEGHLSLVRASTAKCGFTAVTIFVNPTQFAPNEDLQAYPRTLQKDIDALSQCGVDLVFAPENRDIYPEGFSTYVDPPQVAQPLEGGHRPGHFRGVATVVLKLFNLLPADIAFFGQKDYQQSLVIRRMVEDLGLGIEIRTCPIVRESDGLALSSRNVYLSPSQREQALAISRSLTQATQLFAAGQRNTKTIRDTMRQTLIDAGISNIDYVALVDPDNLAEVEEITVPVMALIAAHVGKTRLIDNCRIG